MEKETNLVTRLIRSTILKAKITVFIIVFFVTAFSDLFAQNEVKVLVVLPAQYGANFYLNLDNFERFGWKVTITGLTQTIYPCPAYAGPLGCPGVKADKLISQIENVKEYDCLVVMSATSYTATLPCNALINSSEALGLIKAAVDSGIVVAAMCSGVRVLAAANVINGKNVTGNDGYKQEYIAAGANYLGRNHYPVIDGNIITTAAGDFFNLQNCNAIAKAINANMKNKNMFNSTMIVNDIELKKSLFSKDITFLTYGGSESDGGRAICETADGGFLIAGYTFSQGEGKADILLMKTDNNGNQLWAKTFGGSRTEYTNSVYECTDGSIILAGFTNSIGAGNEDVLIIKTDASGNKLWEKYYGGAGSEQGNKIIEMSNGNYLVAGFTDSFGSGEDDAYLLCLDSSGDTLWTKTSGNQNSQFAKDIYPTENGKFLVVGSTGYFTAQGWGNRDVYLLEYDSSGNCSLSKSYGESSYQNWGNSICALGDGSYIIAGDADITNQDLYQVYAMKTNPSLNLLWHKRYGESTYYDYGNSITKVNPNNYLICGTTKSPVSKNDIYILNIDADGNLLQKKIIKENNSDWASSSCLTKDGEYLVLTGHTNSAGAGNFDVLFVKVPIELLVSEIKNEMDINYNFELNQNYPNPFNPETTIGFKLATATKVSMKVFDVLGREIQTLINKEMDAGNHQINFKAEDIPSGIYMCRLEAGKSSKSVKMLLVK